jgi:type IV secretion system protein VirD4
MANNSNPIYTLPKSKLNSGVRWRALIIGFTLLLLVSVVATEYLAFQFSHQPALGSPLFSFLGFHLYHPAKWIVWIWRYRGLQQSEVQHIFLVTYMIASIGSFLAILTAAYVSYRRSAKQDLGLENVHGSAHWATPKEVKATGLLTQGEGVYVGGWKHPKSGEIRYLRHNGPEHIISFAPTRSGKGVGLVLPTLLSWPHSALVYDIKGENWALTAGWRRAQANNHVLKFEPTATDDSSVAFNPLEEIRLGTEREVSDVQNIVTMIVDPDGRGLNDHWAKTGHALLVGSVLHVLYAERDKTLSGVAQFLSEPSRSMEETLFYMIGTEHDPSGKRAWRDGAGKPTGCHPVVAACARDMLNKSENERSGVLSTAMSFLTLYRDPTVAFNTRCSQFRLSDLMNNERPVSLYLVVPPSDKDRLKPLIRLIVNQVVRGLTEKMDFRGGRSVAAYRHRLLLMIDEFPSLGRLDVFQESLAFIAGYGLKAYLIIQDLAQLWAAYGKDEAIFSNCHVRNAFAPNKIETAEFLSKMTGTATVVTPNLSFSGRRLSPMLSNVTTSLREMQRPLLTPDEVMRLPSPSKDGDGNILEAGDMLIFVAGHPPIYGKQILYFIDPVFSARAKIPAPRWSDRLCDPQADSPADANGSSHAAISTPAHQAADDAELQSYQTAAAGTSVPPGEEAPSLEQANQILEHEEVLDLLDAPGGSNATWPDDILKQAIEVSAHIDTPPAALDAYALFEDQLSSEPTGPGAVASVSEQEFPSGAPPDQLDGLIDLLSEIMQDEPTR